MFPKTGWMSVWLVAPFDFAVVRLIRSVDMTMFLSVAGIGESAIAAFEFAFERFLTWKDKDENCNCLFFKTFKYFKIMLQKVRTFVLLLISKWLMTPFKVFVSTQSTSEIWKYEYYSHRQFRTKSQMEMKWDNFVTCKIKKGFHSQMISNWIKNRNRFQMPKIPFFLFLWIVSHIDWIETEITSNADE